MEQVPYLPIDAPGMFSMMSNCDNSKEIAVWPGSGGFHEPQGNCARFTKALG